MEMKVINMRLIEKVKELSKFYNKPNTFFKDIEVYNAFHIIFYNSSEINEWYCKMREDKINRIL